MDETRPSSIGDLRWRLAELAEVMAEHEVRFADYLEGAARRGDRGRRLAVAAEERRAAAEHRLLAEAFRQSARSSFDTARGALGTEVGRPHV